MELGRYFNLINLSNDLLFKFLFLYGPLRAIGIYPFCAVVIDVGFNISVGEFFELGFGSYGRTAVSAFHHSYEVKNVGLWAGSSFAAERSWGKLKTALNVWLLSYLNEPRSKVYSIIVGDLIKTASVLAPLIGKALEAYRPIREQEVNRKSERAKRTEKIEIPRQSIFYTDQYEEMDVKKAAMAPFYIEKNYKGEDNEKEFIKFLEESKSVAWWYKNGDSGSEFFSISYFNPDENKEKLFYPDWIFKAKDKIWIIDTKKGATAELADTAYKAEALQEWLKGKKGFAGGITVQDGPNGWMVNSNAKYSYSTALKGWAALRDLLN